MDAIFFDIDDTLYDQAQPFCYAVRTVVGPVSMTDDQLFASSRRHSDEVFAALAAGKRPSDATYVRRMRETLADAGVDISDSTARQLQRVYATSSGTAMTLYPGMEKVLSECKQHAQVGVISNGRGARQRDKLRILGIDRWVRPEAIFISDELGMAKPDPQIFRFACSRIGARPEHSVYVGDSLASDVPGALDAGLRVVWFHHRESLVPTDKKVESKVTAPRPTWTVTTTQELLALLHDVLSSEDEGATRQTR